MQEEIRFATFNAFNLAPPGALLYEGMSPCTRELYEAKLAWTARQIDLLDADVIGFQEIFSQAVLKEALARTTRYRNAHHVGFDPDPTLDKLTPSVALVSRLPLASAGTMHPLFPSGVNVPSAERGADRFVRPVVHAAVAVAPDVVVDVVVVHLKSRRPDYLAAENPHDAQDYALACLRSLVRRGTEAVALRVMLSRLRQQHGRARVVLGDFNDTADAVTTSIVLGEGAADDRFFDAYQIQARQDRLRNVGFSSVHEGHYSTIDHILVSGEFNGALPGAIGEVVDVLYLNDHLDTAAPEASDHGQVVARIRLFDPAQRMMDTGA